MLNKFNYLFIYFLLQMLFISCREDIIEPNNPAGNKNFPVREEKENYLNIVINADKLTKEMFFDAQFTSENNMISLTVDDKQSGVCTLRVLSNENKILYSSIIEISNINIRQRINRGLPSKVYLKTDNFTGKIKIIISKSFLKERL